VISSRGLALACAAQFFVVAAAPGDPSGDRAGFAAAAGPAALGGFPFLGYKGT
jgi:hypothetical protein